MSENVLKSLPQLFHALNGKEIVAAIKQQMIDEIAKKIEADYRFAEHLCYPIVEWEFELKLTCYPTEPGTFRFGLMSGKRAKMDVHVILGARKVDSSSDDATPDAVREEFGLPVSVPEKTDAGYIADVPQPVKERK